MLVRSFPFDVSLLLPGAAGFNVGYPDPPAATLNSQRSVKKPSKGGPLFKHTDWSVMHLILTAATPGCHWSAQPLF